MRKKKVNKKTLELLVQIAEKKNTPIGLFSIPFNSDITQIDISEIKKAVPNFYVRGVTDIETNQLTELIFAKK